MSSVDSTQERPDLAQISCATKPLSKKRKLTLAASIAAEHAPANGTATEHASASASAKVRASADDTPLETLSPKPDSSCGIVLPDTLRQLAAAVKKQADNYESEASPDIYYQGEPLKLRDIRDDYMHEQRSCDQNLLYTCIKALLVVYHVGKFEHTAAMTECVKEKLPSYAAIIQNVR